MNKFDLSKFFPVWLHVILATTAIGAAMGVWNDPHSTIILKYSLNGFAVGCGATALIRFLCS